MENEVDKNNNSALSRVSDIEKVDIKLKLLNQLGRHIQDLQTQIETLENGMPTAYIDPQVILELVTGNEDYEFTQSEISMATVDIDYVDGFPVVNGLPLWERLDCEPLDLYKLYKLYRNQKVTESTRSFEKLISQTGNQFSVAYVAAYSKIYHWSLRNNAFDSYNTYLVDLEREKAVKTLEGKHRDAAEKIFDICVQYLETLDETKLIAQMRPNEVLGWAEMAVKLNRIALGLPPDKPKEIGKVNQGQNQNTIIIDKSQNINVGVKDKGNKRKSEVNINEEDRTYLQEVVNVLSKAGQLPKDLKAQLDVVENTDIDNMGNNDIIDAEIAENSQ